MDRVDPNIFKWYSPNHKTRLTISIPNEEIVYFSPNLAELLPPAVAVGFSPDGGMIALRQDENGYHIHKNHTIKSRDLVQVLTNTGVELPVKYTVEEQDDLWIGVLKEKSK